MSRYSDFYERQYYEPSRPRKVDGGLRARSSRGPIGESWWSRRFVDVIESFALGNRLTRGRGYARAGQVISLEVAPGKVTAQVQGSRVRPYSTTIGLDPFAALVWRRIEAKLAEQALFSAQLLAGQMPHELEGVFAAAGVSLFPASVRELDLRCSCPDSAVPCKHLAATLYLLAESFDADPFQILYWRGRARDQLLARLRELRASTSDAEEEVDATSDSTPGADPGAGPGAVPGNARPAEVDLERFWVAPKPLPPRPSVPATAGDLVLRQLPEPDHLIGGARLLVQLRRAYTRFGAGEDAR